MKRRHESRVKKWSMDESSEGRGCIKKIDERNGCRVEKGRERREALSDRWPGVKGRERRMGGRVSE